MYVRGPGDWDQICGDTTRCLQVRNMIITEQHGPRLLLLLSGLQSVLYKAVFHGGVKSMWSSVMEVRTHQHIVQPAASENNIL